MVGTRKTMSDDMVCLPVGRPLPMAVRKILDNGAGGRHHPIPLTQVAEVKELIQHSPIKTVRSKPLVLPPLSQPKIKPDTVPNQSAPTQVSQTPQVPMKSDTLDSEEYGNIIVSTNELKKMIHENLTCSVCAKKQLVRFNRFCDNYRKTEIS